MGGTGAHAQRLERNMALEENDTMEGKIKKKRVRRGGKKVKNKLKNFKIMYVNLRGYKSKKRSIEEIIIEEKPTVVAFAETLLEEKEKVKIEGYETYVPEEKGSRGIMIAVNKDLEKITSVVMEDAEQGEQLWIQIVNGQIDIRIGLVYAPQESRTKVCDLKKMYKKIEEQVNKGKEKDQKVLIVGDLNCKIGNKIKGNTEQVTTGGRLLIQLVEKLNLEIINAHPKCQGLWTRQEGGKKSVLDYIIIDKEHVESIKEMNIDEEREITPYSQGEIKGERTYTDHNMIKVNINWRITSINRNQERLTMNEKSKKNFKEATENGKLTEIWEREGSVQERYNIWSEEVEKVAKQHFITRKKKKKPFNRVIRKLRRKRRLLKEETAGGEVKEMNKKRRKLLQQLIDEELAKQEKNRIISIANNIKKEKGFDANAFWELDKRLKSRNGEVATAMMDEEGKLEEDPEKIREIYKRFYQKLLKDREPEN